MNYSVDISKIMSIVDRPIAYHRCFVTISGSVTAAVMLSQAMYWTPRTTLDPDGWFFKTQEEWAEETGLSRTEQENARRVLRGIGVLEEKKQGVPCRLFFKVNTENLYLRLMEPVKVSKGKFSKSKEDSPQTSLQETRRLDCRKPADWIAGNPQTIYIQRILQRILQRIQQRILSEKIPP